MTIHTVNNEWKNTCLCGSFVAIAICIRGVSSLSCYSCPSKLTQDGCKAVDTCGLGEVCLLRRTSSNDTHSIFYESRCFEKKACDRELERYRAIITALIGRKRELSQVNIGPVCLIQCCDEDLCNNGCKVTDSTNIVSTTGVTQTASINSVPQSTPTPLFQSMSKIQTMSTTLATTKANVTDVTKKTTQVAERTSAQTVVFNDISTATSQFSTAGRTTEISTPPSQSKTSAQQGLQPTNSTKTIIQSEPSSPSSQQTSPQTLTSIRTSSRSSHLTSLPTPTTTSSVPESLTVSSTVPVPQSNQSTMVSSTEVSHKTFASQSSAVEMNGPVTVPANGHNISLSSAQTLSNTFSTQLNSSPSSTSYSKVSDMASKSTMHVSNVATGTAATMTKDSNKSSKIPNFQTTFIPSHTVISKLAEKSTTLSIAVPTKPSQTSGAISSAETSAAKTSAPTPIKQNITVQQTNPPVSSSSAAGTRVCPYGGVEFESSCYFFSNLEMTFTSAFDFCKRHNSHLVYVDSDRENQFLKNHLKFLNRGAVQYWIGITDHVTENIWRFYDNGKVAPFYDWAPCEPDGVQTFDGNAEAVCAVFDPFLDFQWRDEDCSPYQYSEPICERENL